MLGTLIVPPRLVLRAFDDLHALAEGMRLMTDSEADLRDLLAAVRALPEVEAQLSLRIDRLQAEIGRLLDWLQPLHAELGDLDETAEALQVALGSLQAQIGKLPGL